jgi:hypothetical protein
MVCCNCGVSTVLQGAKLAPAAAAIAAGLAIRYAVPIPEGLTEQVGWQQQQQQLQEHQFISSAAASL